MKAFSRRYSTPLHVEVTSHTHVYYLKCQKNMITLGVLLPPQRRKKFGGKRDLSFIKVDPNKTGLD